MKPKKTLLFILVLALVLSLVPGSVSWAEGKEYGTISACLSNGGKSQLNLRVMVENGNVYADANQLGEILNYTVNADNGIIVFSNMDRADDSYGLVMFTVGETKATRYVGPYMVNSYEAPFAPKQEESGVWVPLSYTCKMLKSKLYVQDKQLCISMPVRNIMDEYAYVKENSLQFIFNLLTENAYEGFLETVMAASVHNTRVCKEFLDLLFLNGESMTKLVISWENGAGTDTILDYSLGEELARLLCLSSDEELRAALEENAEKMKTVSDILSLEKDQSIDALPQILSQMQGLENSGDVKNEIAYMEQAYEACQEYSEYFDDISDISHALKIISNVAAIYCSSEEYKDSDEFALEAMESLLENAKDSQLLSEPSQAALESSVQRLSSNAGIYSASEYILNQGADLVLDAIQLGDSFTAQYKILQLGWNLSKEYIPGLSSGMKAADEFELSLLASSLQAEAYRQYSKDENLLNFSADSQELYEMMKPFYVYLKAGYAARKAALAYAEHTLGQDNEEVVYMKEEFAKRDEMTAEILAEVKKAQKDNGNGAFGFLPADNKKYLETYSDQELLGLVSYGESSEDNAVSEDADYTLYIPAVQQAIDGRIYGTDCYGILEDLNADGILELVMLHEYEQNGLPAIGLSVYGIDQGSMKCIVEKKEVMTLTGGGAYFAGITEYEGEKYVYTYSIRMADVYAVNKLTVYDHDMSVFKSFNVDISYQDLYLPENYTANYSIDGKSCEEEEYLCELDEIFSFNTDCFMPGETDVYAKSGMFYSGKWYGTELERLLEMLDNNLSQITGERVDGAVFAAYKPVLDSYYNALCEEYSLQQATEAGLSYLIGYGDISNIGYTFIDVDGNGSPELFIGEINIQGDYVGMFFDMYTISDQGAVRVISSGERNRFYLCEDMSLGNEASSGAAISYWRYYRFTGDSSPSLIKGIVYDADYSPDAPWFLCQRENEYGGFSQENYIPVSEAEAKEIIGSHAYRKIEFMAFEQYLSYSANFSGSSQNEKIEDLGTNDDTVIEYTEVEGDVGLTETEAMEIASLYWGDLLGESDDTWSDFAVRADGTTEYNGKLYYRYNLTGLAEGNRTAIDYLFIDAENGDCYAGVSYPEELKRKGSELLA